MQVHCLSLLPVSRVTSLCYKSESFINAASLCIHFENSFCLKRKTHFDIHSIKKLYDELVEAKMEELAENLHSVIANIECKIAALSDSESTGSNKSRTNSFIEQNTTEKIANHKIENASIASHSNVNGKDLDGSLELLVNQDETVTPTDTEIQVSNLINATSDVITEIETPELVVISNSDEFADDKSGNNAKADTVVQNQDENAIISQDVITVKPVYENWSQTEESQEQENDLGNHNQQLEKDENLIGDVVDQRIGVSEEMNTLQNHVGSTQIQIEMANKDFINTHIAGDSNANDTETVTVHINGDEDNCKRKGTENNIETVIQSEVDKGVLGTDKGAYESIAMTRIEAFTAETLENNSVKDAQDTEIILEAKSNNVPNDSEVTKNQSKNKAENCHHENSANKDKDKLTIDDHEAVRAKSPVFAEHSPVRSKSPAPSVSSQKSNSSKKSGDLDDILEDDLDLFQSRSSTMGSRRLSLTSLSSLSSAEVVLEQVAGSKYIFYCFPLLQDDLDLIHSSRVKWDQGDCH